MLMLYASWFVILYIMVISLLLTILCRRAFLDFKKSFSIFCTIWAVVLVLFYFLIPVPIKAQEKQIRFAHNFIDNNKSASTFNMQLWHVNECDGSLKAYQYFLFIKALNKDIDTTLEANKIVNFGEVGSDRNFKEKQLCEIKFSD